VLKNFHFPKVVGNTANKFNKIHSGALHNTACGEPQSSVSDHERMQSEGGKNVRVPHGDFPAR